MRVYVGGSYRDVHEADAIRAFVSTFGGELVSHGHQLLTGCRNPFDAHIAEAAFRSLVESKKGDPKKYVISYWQRDAQKAHAFGTVRLSALPDWKMSHAELRVPEQIQRADLAVFIGGGEGTYLARNWAHWARKRIVGVPRFGGAGAEIYRQELMHLQQEDHGASDQYEQLNEMAGDIGEYADRLVPLLETLLVPRKVFAIMSFKPEQRNIFDKYESACSHFGFDADRTDETYSSERINPRIESEIRKSAFVIVDVSEPSPNVFFELGFARGCGKDVIVTAREDTQLPFDITDIPVLKWENLDQLESRLRKAIADVKRKLTRCENPVR